MNPGPRRYIVQASTMLICRLLFCLKIARQRAASDYSAVCSPVCGGRTFRKSLSESALRIRADRRAPDGTARLFKQPDGMSNCCQLLLFP